MLAVSTVQTTIGEPQRPFLAYCQVENVPVYLRAVNLISTGSVTELKNYMYAPFNLNDDDKQTLKYYEITPLI